MSAQEKGSTVVPARFNPREHLRPIKGKGGSSDYLEVKWRLVWLREEHPDAAIETEMVAGGIESNFAVFRARVSVPGGGSATGWGSQTKAGFPDFLEKAETKAIGRALAALGYGTQFAPELDEDGGVADSPARRPARPAAPPAPGKSVDDLATDVIEWFAGKPGTPKQVRWAVDKLAGLTNDAARHEAWLVALLQLCKAQEQRDLVRRVATPLVHQDALDAAWFAVMPPAEVAAVEAGAAGAADDDQVPF